MPLLPEPIPLRPRAAPVVSVPAVPSVIPSLELESTVGSGILVSMLGSMVGMMVGSVVGAVVALVVGVVVVAVVASLPLRQPHRARVRTSTIAKMANFLIISILLFSCCRFSISARFCFIQFFREK